MQVRSLKSEKQQDVVDSNSQLAGEHLDHGIHSGI
jgi:hypothetical protein